jgi:hypothetical protein
MSDVALLAVFFVGFTIVIMALAYSLCLIIGHLFNIGWILLTKVFPNLPSREQLEKDLAKDVRDLADVVESKIK